MENILEIKNLSKRFRSFELSDLEFALPRGYILGFIGPNGAGKSTTMKLIMNLIKRDNGDIKVLGMDNREQEVEIKNKIGFVYDENYFYEEATIKRMESLLSRFYKNWERDTFYEYLNRFKLDPKKKIKELSRGLKTKFALAVAFSHQAELLLMDEPTAGLDPLVRSELLDILLEFIRDENKGVVFSTHITSDLDKVADYIALINEGKLVAYQTRDELLESYRVVKGDLHSLQRLDKKLLTGLKSNSYGFEALIGADKISSLNSQEELLLERPVLEDIMVFMARGHSYV